MMNSRWRNAIFACIAILFLALLVLVTRSWREETRALRTVSMPNPNGYDLLRDAAAAVLLEARGPVTNDLRALVASNTAAYMAFSNALRFEAEAPVSFYSPTADTLAPLSGLKKLALAVEAQGRLEEQAGRTSHAARVYMQIIEMGHKIERGPFIACLVGLAVENIGAGNLERVWPSLSAEEQSSASAALRGAQAARISWEEIVRREKIYARAALPSALKRTLIQLTQGKAMRAVLARTQQRREAATARLENLIQEKPAGAGQ